METETGTFRPPYMSFQTFWNFIEELASKPLPPTVDRTIMKSKSGTDQANLTMALTSFGLTDADGNVLPTLTALVNVPAEERRAAFGEFIDGFYREALEVSEANGTPGDLDRVFRETYPSIASGDTRRKAITFFMHAARSAGKELSPHFPTTRSGSGAPGTAKPRKSRPRRPVNPAGETPAAPSNPAKPGAHTHTVTLKSGGTVTLSYNVNMFEVDEAEEQFVLGLIKKLRGYKPDAPAPATSEGGGPVT